MLLPDPPAAFPVVRASWQERFANYRRVIGKSPHLHQNEEDGWIEGYWLFNDYSRHADYHGAYAASIEAVRRVVLRPQACPACV